MAEIAEAVATWGRLADECQRYRYMARAIELQQDAIAKLDAFEAIVDAGRQDARACGRDDDANACLSLQSVVHALASELRMFVALKEDRTGDAWDHLVAAQNAAHGALMAHGAVAAERHLLQLLAHEENLFPPQIFLSLGMVVAHSQCSICESRYGECTHVAGRAYAGEFCTRVITEVAQLDEVSVVMDPKDKRRRVTAIGIDGVQRDYLTWRPVPGADDGGR
jgi:hypothetical protein